MANKETILEWLTSDPGKAALAGALGGIVRWLTLRHDWKEGMVTLIVGAICAMYLGPLVLPLIEPLVGSIAPDNDAGGLASFLVGMGGITLTGVILDLFERRKRDLKDDDDA